MELVEFSLDNGGSVLVEVTPSPYESAVSRPGDVFTQVAVSFDQAIGRIRGAAEAALDQFDQMTRRPDELAIAFGVKLDAQVGAVIARSGIEGQLQVTLTWHAPELKPAP
jgi:hypothetical protein